VQRQRLDAADELVNLAIAVAGYVDVRSPQRRPLVQSAHRHHWEELPDAPVVGHQREHEEVHVVVVDGARVAGHPLAHLLGQLVHLDALLKRTWHHLWHFE
jgi:hypothetical protein